jgi:hypothetical protein
VFCGIKDLVRRTPAIAEIRVRMIVCPHVLKVSVFVVISL